MLEILRNAVRSWYFKALLGILVVSFAIWGVGDIFRPGLHGGAILKVGDVKVGEKDVATAIRRQLKSLQQSLGTEISMDQARKLGIVDRVMETLITQALYTNEVKALGVTATDQDIARQIREQPGFRNKQGLFDRGIFQQTLAVNGYSEAEFIGRLRQELAREQVLGSFSGYLHAPTQLAERLYRYRQEKRVADYFTIALDPNADVGSPSAEEMKSYYEKNKQLFTAPEYRDASYILLTPAVVAGEITIPEQDIRARYDERIADFKIGEQRSVQQMVFPTEKAAKDAEAQLKEGKDFTALAKTLLKQDESTTNVLGDVTRADLPKALSDAVFSLQKDQFTVPLKGPFGWHIIRVTAIKPPYTKPFEKVRESLRAEMVSEKSGSVLYDLSKNIDDALGGGATLEEAASKAGVTVKKVTKVDRQGLGVDGQPIADLPKDPTFLKTVFDTPSGEDNLVDVGTDSDLILRVDAITPSQVRPLDTVRDRIVQTWQAEKRRDLTAQKAQDAVKRIAKGALIDSVAKDMGAAVETSPPFTREGEGAEQKIPRELAADLFAGKLGDAATAPFGSGHVVAVLKAIEPVDVVKQKAAVDALADQLAQRIGSDLLVEYNHALRQEYAVEVDQKALDALLQKL